MIRLLSLVLLFSALMACEGNTAARKAARGPFYVAAPNRLYFKNIRIRHYQTEEPEEGLILFRHDNLLDSDAAILPVIMDYWLEDQAILRLDIRPEPGQPATIGSFKLEVEEEGGWQSLPLTTPTENAELAQLRNILATSKEIRAITPTDTLNAFPGNTRDAAKEVLDDYLRMVAW